MGTSSTQPLVIMPQQCGSRPALDRPQSQLSAWLRQKVLDHLRAITKSLAADIARVANPQVKGLTLGEFIYEMKTAGHKTSPEIAVAIICELLERLETLDNEGRLPCSLNPNNLMLARAERGKPLLQVIDSGIKKESLAGPIRAGAKLDLGSVARILEDMFDEERMPYWLKPFVGRLTASEYQARPKTFQEARDALMLLFYNHCDLTRTPQPLFPKPAYAPVPFPQRIEEVLPIREITPLEQQLLTEVKALVLEIGEIDPPNEIDSKANVELTDAEGGQGERCYTVTHFVAEGGMSKLWLANSSAGKSVILKQLKHDPSDYPELISRMHREAMIGRCKDLHPRIPPVLDFQLDKAPHLIVFPYLEGLNLRQILEAGKRFTPGQALAIILSLIDALEAASCRGFIHRDIKPENVMVVLNEDMHPVMLLDWGVARDESLTEDITQPGMVMGTPQFLDWEAYRIPGGKASELSDEFSLGLCLAVLLLGEQVRLYPSLVETLVAPVLTEEETSTLAQIDQGLLALVQKMADRAPSERFSSLAELRTVILDDLPRIASLSGRGAG